MLLPPSALLHALGHAQLQVPLHAPKTRLTRAPHAQTCRWSFLAFSGDFDCTFLVQQQSQTRELEFKLQESSFMVGLWLTTLTVKGRISIAAIRHAGYQRVI